jgi:hypothetical protein
MKPLSRSVNSAAMPRMCEGKAGFWKTFLNNLGNAIGQAKFGGDS